jgi:DNA-binding MarR family transcriptional regulator
MTSQDKINNYITVMEFLLKAKHQLMTTGVEFGLTGVQTITLVLVKPDMPSPMNTLCSFFSCDASNMTGIIDGLEQKGLVSRQSSDKDRRIKVVKILPAGNEVRDQIMGRLTGSECVFNQLTQAETEQLVALIRKMSETFA